MFIFKKCNHISKKTERVEIWEQLQRNIEENPDNIAQPTKFNCAIKQSSKKGEDVIGWHWRYLNVC